MVDDDEPAPPAAGDDRRVKDLVRAGESEEIAPETQADLARWFGLPSFVQVDEEAVRAAKPAASTVSPEVAARQAEMARATAAIDPATLTWLAQRRRGFDAPMVIEFREIARRRPPIEKLDPRAVRAVLLEPRELDIPEWLVDAMQEATPQAVLRDLHRPETTFEPVLEVDPRLHDLTAPVDPGQICAAAMRAQRRFEVRPPLMALAAEALAPLVRAKREPWGALGKQVEP